MPDRWSAALHDDEGAASKVSRWFRLQMEPRLFGYGIVLDFLSLTNIAKANLPLAIHIRLVRALMAGKGGTIVLIK